MSFGERREPYNSDHPENLLPELANAIRYATTNPGPDSHNALEAVVERAEMPAEALSSTGDVLASKIASMDRTVENLALAAGNARALLETLGRPEGLRVRSDWKGEVSPRRWLCPGWLPRGRVALLTGEGGSGKSVLALQLACAVAAEKAVRGPGQRCRPVVRTLTDPRHENAPPRVWLEQGDKPETVVFLTWEDEPDEVLRRLALMPKAADRTALRAGLGDRLHVIDMAGRGPLWGPAPGQHAALVAETTRAGREAEAYIRKAAPALVVVDPLAGAYGANENDRAAVRAFMAHWGCLAAETGAAVLIVAHPPKVPAGAKATPVAYSGSTDWRNAARALWTLSPTPLGPGLKETTGGAKSRKTEQGMALTREKSSYSRTGQRAWLRFVADGSSADGKQGGPSRLFWESCTVQESADALRRHREWLAPSSREPVVGARSESQSYAKGVV